MVYYEMASLPSQEVWCCRQCSEAARVLHGAGAVVEAIIIIIVNIIIICMRFLLALVRFVFIISQRCRFSPSSPRGQWVLIIWAQGSL